MTDEPYRKTPPYFDGERLVLPNLMMWVEETKDDWPWAIADSEGGIEYFRTKDDAKAQLRRYAEEG